jgi:predicted regulator of amino acid metabolism with ACT domain
MTRKTAYTVNLPYELGRKIEDTHKQFSAGSRYVSRNEIFQRLIEDGYRMWKREAQTVSVIEMALSTLVERMTVQEKLMRSILLTLAEGDVEEVDRLMKMVEKPNGTTGTEPHHDA